MKRLFVVLLITLGLSSALSAQEHTNRPPQLPPSTSTPANNANVNNGGWSKFTSQEGRFSILMPGTPENKEETTQSDHGPYTTHLFILRQPPNVYLVGYVDYDPSFNFNRQAELEANRDNFVKGISATLLSTKPLKIDGYAAIEFTAETAQRIFRSRVYMVGRRPYQIVIGSPKNVDDSANIDRFFSSFKVVPN